MEIIKPGYIKFTKGGLKKIGKDLGENTDWVDEMLPDKELNDMAEKHRVHCYGDSPEWEAIENDFKAGANWMKEKMESCGDASHKD